jgi:hypothetical protein
VPRALGREFGTIGIEVPLGRLPQNFKAAALWSRRIASGEGR